MDWISVKDKLPDEAGWYLTSSKDYNIDVNFFGYIWYYRDVDFPCDKDFILAWMPLPEPYKLEDSYNKLIDTIEKPTIAEMREVEILG